MQNSLYRRLLIIIAFILVNVSAFAQVRIVASISPLTAIITMLIGDAAIVDTIAVTQTCPHHYHMKPSDLQKIKNADIVVYIDDKFDGFIVKALSEYDNKVVKISSLEKLKILKTNSNQNNWHLWLDLDNVNMILEHLSPIFIRSFPLLKDHISGNLELAKMQLKKLSAIKNRQLRNLNNIILLNSDVEYFFTEKDNIHKPCSDNYKSLKCVANIEQLLAQSTDKCIIVTENHDSSILSRFNAQIVQLQPDNWGIVDINGQSFYKHYLQMIDQITKCTY